MKRLLSLLLVIAITACNQQEPQSTGAELSNSKEYAKVPYVVFPQPPGFFEQVVRARTLSGFPEADSQGNIQSCVSWATGYYLMSYHNARVLGGTVRFDDPSKTFNPLYVHNQLIRRTGGCSGERTSLVKVLDFMITNGTVSNKDFNEKQSCGVMPSPILKPLALQHQFRNYAQICNPKSGLEPGVAYEKIKTNILNGLPVVITMPVSPNFFDLNAADTVWRSFNTSDTSNTHTMLCIGFSDDLQSVQVINSWGKTWGNKGRGWIHVKLLNKYLLEAMTPNINRRFLVPGADLLFASYQRQPKRSSNQKGFEGFSPDHNTLPLEEGKYEEINQIRVVPINVSDSSCVFKIYEKQRDKLLLKDFATVFVKTHMQFKIDQKSYILELISLKPASNARGIATVHLKEI